MLGDFSLKYPSRLEMPWPSSGGGNGFLWCWASCEAPVANSPASSHILPWGMCEVAAGLGPEWCTQSPMRNHKERISTAVPTTWGSSMEDLTANRHSSLTGGSHPANSAKSCVSPYMHEQWDAIWKNNCSVSCQGATTSLMSSSPTLPLPLMREW